MNSILTAHFVAIPTAFFVDSPVVEDSEERCEEYRASTPNGFFDQGGQDRQGRQGSGSGSGVSQILLYGFEMKDGGGGGGSVGRVGHVDWRRIYD